ncbi:MAG: hypothetical protein HYW69_01565 [Candidatus Nealsonbacteria bacterium]|nr:hypothetical protein [Candidatus Nealsonbacteria bacterium]
MGKILLISFLFLFISLPVLTQAGLVPCGLSADDPNQEGNQTTPCTLCHLFVLFNNIIKFAMTTLVPVIAVLMLVIGGVMFFFAGAKPDTLNQAKGIITSVVIGLLIIFSAWIIVNTVLNFSGIVTSPSLLKWYDIGCSI